MPKISQTSKMKIRGAKVGSWSLPAGPSCPGSVIDGKIAEVCAGCYAKKGMYRFPTVKGVREYNKDDYKKDDWVERMVKQVSKYDYFRWFDSGDIESAMLAIKIAHVIELTPSTKHWLPTRSDKIPQIKAHIIANPNLIHFPGSGTIQNYKNVAVRLSADNIGLDKPERPGVNSYVIRHSDLFEAAKRGIHLCPVTAPGSTQKSCDTCTMCYTNNPVAYMLH